MAPTTNQSLAAQKSFFQAFRELRYMIFIQVPWPLRLWLYCLKIPTFAYFYFRTPFARTVFFVANTHSPLMVLIYQRYGFVKLTGLAHITWIPLWIWMYTQHWSKASKETTETLEYKWMSYLLVVMGISIILDFKDVVQYVFLGQRQPIMYYKNQPPKAE